jgi:hypothetical protein
VSPQKNIDVFVHRIFNLVVIWQFGAACQRHRFDGTACSSGRTSAFSRLGLRFMAISACRWSARVWIKRQARRANWPAHRISIKMPPMQYIF